MLLVLVFGSFRVCVCVFFVCVCVWGDTLAHAHAHLCLTHTHISASPAHISASHTHTHTSLCRTHAHISTPRTHKISVACLTCGGWGGELEGFRVCARSVPSSPDVAPCSNGHTGQRGFVGLLDRNIAQALRQHKARRFIFYSDSSAGVLFEARF